MIAALVERRQVIERFEFNGLLNRQTNEDAPPIFIDKIPPRRMLPEVSLHAVRFHLRSRDPLEHQGTDRKPMRRGDRRSRGKARLKTSPSDCPKNYRHQTQPCPTVSSIAAQKLRAPTSRSTNR